jgi:nitrogen fixation protein FixH
VTLVHSADPAVSVGNSGTTTLPVAGDIISMWGGSSGQGQSGLDTHVAVVTGVSGSAGTGWTISVMEENASTGGANTISVSASGSSWRYNGGYYTSFDWLNLSTSGAGSTGGGGTGVGALALTQAATLSASGGMDVYQPLTFSFQVQNVSGVPASVQRIEVAIRGPSGEGLDKLCSGGAGLTLAAGQVWTCTASATTGFGSPGTYTYWADWLDYNGNWHQGQLGPNQTFTLQATGQTLALAQAVTLSAQKGMKTKQPITFSFQVFNVTTAPVKAKKIEVAVRGPSGQVLDTTCAGGTAVTLAAGQVWTCTATAAKGFAYAGTYTYWADWIDSNGNSHQGQLGPPSQTFALSQT